MDGDPDARFDDLFRREHDPIRRVVVLIVRDRAIAEEITQEAFTRAFVRWRRIDRYERPGAWVRLVAVRLAVKAARRAERGVAVAATAASDRSTGWGGGEGVGPFGADPGEPGGPGGPGGRLEISADMAAAMAVLSPQQRAAVVLHHLEDLPVAEVARVLGCSAATVKVHLHRGRTRLAELLAPNGDGDASHSGAVTT